MEGFTASVLSPAILVLELGLLLKLIQLAVSVLQSNAWSLRSMLADCKKQWWELWNKFKKQCLEKADALDPSEQELARMRCIWTRRAWFAALAINMLRLLSRQTSGLLWHQAQAEFDLGVLWLSAMGLVITWSIPAARMSCT
ncbi:unnamed protein product [Effrenium voratum]|nr:unnamed protein product [Effrenium voratum]